MKINNFLICAFITASLLSGCASNSVTSQTGYQIGDQTASSRKHVRKRRDPAVRLDLGEAGQLLNEYRQRYNLGALTHNAQLQKAAERHARELARWSRVSHSGRNGSNPAQRVARTGYKWSAIGENVSAGRNTIPDVLKAWHKSRPHRKNLKLRQAVHFGLAVQHNPDSVLSNYWVLVLGAPARKARGSSGGSMRIGIGG